jgi:hypothetical protein
MAVSNKLSPVFFHPSKSGHKSPDKFLPICPSPCCQSIILWGSQSLTSQKAQQIFGKSKLKSSLKSLGLVLKRTLVC